MNTDSSLVLGSSRASNPTSIDAIGRRKTHARKAELIKLFRGRRQWPQAMRMFVFEVLKTCIPIEAYPQRFGRSWGRTSVPKGRSCSFRVESSLGTHSVPTDWLPTFIRLLHNDLRTSLCFVPPSRGACTHHFTIGFQIFKSIQENTAA